MKVMISMHIMGLKLLIDEARLRKMPFHCCFIDFKKAFDSVSWASVRSALHFWHVPESLESAIFSIIEGHKLCVRCGSDVSEPIHIKKGVLQGDTLAPFLFVLVVDQLLRRLPQVGIDVSLHACRRGTISRPQQDNRTILNTFAYADDIAIFAHTSQHLQLLFSSLESLGMQVGLLTNLGKGKTERFVINDTAGQLRTHDGHTIPIVSCYKYLGANVMSPVDDVKQHVASAGQSRNQAQSLHGMCLAGLHVRSPCIRKLQIFAISHLWCVHKNASLRIKC